MVTELRKTVAACELPAAWREEGRFAPEERVTVVITPARAAGDRPLRRFVGAGKGLFASASEIDRHLRRQRDEWMP